MGAGGQRGGGAIRGGPGPAGAREVTEETGISCQITAKSRFSHPAATVLPAPPELPALIERAAEYARAVRG